MVRKRRRRSPGSPGAAEGPEAVRPASVRGTVRLRVRVHPRELLEELRGCADSRTPRRGRSHAPTRSTGRWVPRSWTGPAATGTGRQSYGPRQAEAQAAGSFGHCGEPATFTSSPNRALKDGAVLGAVMLTTGRTARSRPSGADHCRTEYTFPLISKKSSRCCMPQFLHVEINTPSASRVPAPHQWFLRPMPHSLTVGRRRGHR